MTCNKCLRIKRKIHLGVCAFQQNYNSTLAFYFRSFENLFLLHHLGFLNLFRDLRFYKQFLFSKIKPQRYIVVRFGQYKFSSASPCLFVLFVCFFVCMLFCLLCQKCMSNSLSLWILILVKQDQIRLLTGNIQAAAKISSFNFFECIVYSFTHMNQLS